MGDELAPTFEREKTESLSRPVTEPLTDSLFPLILMSDLLTPVCLHQFPSFL